MNKHTHVIPIAGTRRSKYLIKNAHAKDIKLSAEQIKQLDTLFDNESITGERYPKACWGVIER